MILSPKVTGTLMLVFLAGTAGLCLYAHRSPTPLPENAPATDFSAMRALKHIEAFATVPHRSGTDANYAVRDYLMATLRAMGGEPEISENTVLRGDRAASPQNVVVRIAGTAPTRAFMLCAHYDSVAWGPGAADDGAGVAAMLETFRAIKAGPPLRNDVIFLFTDGEETGLMGAQGFLENHPWVKDVGLMLNFEARGTQGLSYLFETSSKNGWLIRQIAKAAPCAMTSSLMYAVYKRMPVSSDYRIFRKTIPGMNVGFIDNLPYYHSPNDNPRNLSPSSLQHHGSYALAFARYFGNFDLGAVAAEPNAVYFNPFGSVLVVYPVYFALPMSIATCILLLAVGVTGLIKRRESWRAILAGLGLFLATALAVAAAVAVALAFAYSFHGIYLLYRSGWYLWSSCLLALAVFLGIQSAWQKKIPAEAFAFSTCIVWQILLFAAVRFTPGASFLFTWPLLFVLVGLGASFLWGPRRLVWAAAALAAVPGILFMVPLIADFFAAVTIALAPGIMVLLVLLLGLLAPQFGTILAAYRKWLPISAGLAGLILLGVGIARGGFDAAHPKMDCLSYALNADSGKALWLSTDERLDEYTSLFFPANAKRQPISEFGYRGFYLAAEAPLAALPAPEIEVKSNSASAGLRTVALHIRSPRHAARMDIQCPAPVSKLTINGKDAGKRASAFTINYLIFPRAGIDLVLETAQTEPLSLSLVDYTYCLPESISINTLPPYIISEPNTINFDRPFQSNVTMMLKSYPLPAPL